jgi:hypothetical protein
VKQWLDDQVFTRNKTNESIQKDLLHNVAYTMGQAGLLYSWRLNLRCYMFSITFLRITLSNAVLGAGSINNNPRRYVPN